MGRRGDRCGEGGVRVQREVVARKCNLTRLGMALGIKPKAGAEGVGWGWGLAARQEPKDRRLELPTTSSRDGGWVEALDTGGSAGHPRGGEW